MKFTGYHYANKSLHYSENAAMNIFTLDQAERMQYVLENHTGRMSLLTGPAL